MGSLLCIVVLKKCKDKGFPRLAALGNLAQVLDQGRPITDGVFKNCNDHLRDEHLAPPALRLTHTALHSSILCDYMLM